MKKWVALTILTLSVQAGAGAYEQGQASYDQQNYTQALKLLQAAAQQGDMRAVAALGVMYKNGEGVTRNYSKALELFTKAAQQGNAKGQNGLGNLYKEGLGVSKNAELARQWYEKAAKQNYIQATYNLGLLYADQRQFAKALPYYTRAAAAGYPPAQINLGNFYLYGEGVAKNPQKAIALFKAAAGQNVPMAYMRLGDVYLNGLGVPVDYQKAKQYIQPLAEAGHLGSQVNLGWLYLQLKQPDLALPWNKQAAGQGDAGAQSRLGYQYEYGLGTSKNLAEARRWYALAAAQGNDYAAKHLAALGGK